MVLPLDMLISDTGLIQDIVLKCDAQDNAGPVAL